MVAVLSFMSFGSAAVAQSALEREKEILPDLLHRIDRTMPTGVGSDTLQSYLEGVNEGIRIGVDDAPEIRKAMASLRLAQIEREQQKLQEMRTELWWTNWIGRVIFVFVQAILILGLVVAWSEFRAAQRQRKAAAGEPSEIRVSLEGIALKSSLHGMLILSMALAFYLLYLRYVYPVTYVGGATSALEG